MDLYEVPIFMCLFGFGMGIMFANSHVCGMKFLFSGMFHILVRYVSPKGHMMFCRVVSLPFLLPLGFELL